MPGRIHRSKSIRRRIARPIDAEQLEKRCLFSVFTLNSSESTIAVSGTINGSPITEQYSGGLTDSYGGTAQIDITGSKLQILSGTTVTADSSGSAEPDGTAANYAGVADGENFAVRGLSVDLTGDITLVGGGTFGVTGTATVPSGAELYLGVEGTPLEVPLSGSVFGNATADNNGTIATSDGTTTITLPLHVIVDRTYDGIAFDLNFDGQMVMTGTPTVTASLSGTTLTVNGTPGADSISVSSSDGEINVDSAGTLVQSFDASDVTSVSVLGGLGPDTISIGADVPASIVIGGLGADFIEATNSANDILAGSAGKDSIDATGSSGNDFLKGGPGPDTLRIGTGTGNETLTGGLGFDSILGGSGANVLAGGPGSDTIIGGIGFETINGGLGNNDIVPGSNDSVVNQ